jgi:CRISPR-associated protein Csx10
MKALTFNLRLIEPVLAARPESGEENSSTSYNFVPGSMIRGALIKRYKKPLSPATDEMARHLFFDGTVCFLNAYPQHAAQAARMLPRPLSWLVAKEQAGSETASMHDFAVKVDPQLGNSKNPKGDFCARAGSAAELYTTGGQVNVHNASDDPNQKTEGKSFVYRYEAIAAGELLSAVIIANDRAYLERLQELLASEIILGGSHTAGYGRAEVIAEPIRSDWHEYAPDGDLGEAVVVTLLSDTIIRNKDGQEATDLDEALATILNVPGLKHVRSYQRMRLVGGFNRKAGLPLQQAWAIQAGSVFVYPPTLIDVTKLHLAAELGIGERRVEGFGRIAINWFTQPTVTRQPLTGVTSEPVKYSLSADSAALARLMAKRRFEILLDSRLIEAVNRARLSDFLPQNSQLSRVRTAAQQALLTKNLNELDSLLGSLKGARAQFERARIDGERMLDWLKARTNMHDAQAQLNIKDSDLPRFAGQTAVFDDALAIEYTARLIDAAMQKAVKQNQSNEAAKAKKTKEAA